MNRKVKLQVLKSLVIEGIELWPGICEGEISDKGAITMQAPVGGSVPVTKEVERGQIVIED